MFFRNSRAPELPLRVLAASFAAGFLATCEAFLIRFSVSSHSPLVSPGLSRCSVLSPGPLCCQPPPGGPASPASLIHLFFFLPVASVFCPITLKSVCRLLSCEQHSVDPRTRITCSGAVPFTFFLGDTVRRGFSVLFVRGGGLLQFVVQRASARSSPPCPPVSLPGGLVLLSFFSSEGFPPTTPPGKNCRGTPPPPPPPPPFAPGPRVFLCHASRPAETAPLSSPANIASSRTLFLRIVSRNYPVTATFLFLFATWADDCGPARHSPFGKNNASCWHHVASSHPFRCSGPCLSFLPFFSTAVGSASCRTNFYPKPPAWNLPSWPRAFPGGGDRDGVRKSFFLGCSHLAFRAGYSFFSEPATRHDASPSASGADAFAGAEIPPCTFRKHTLFPFTGLYHANPRQPP